MPFLPVPPAWVQAGLPTKEELFQYIVDNQDSFNTDIEALKQTSQIDIINVKIAGNPNDYTQSELQSFMPVFKAPVSGTINSVVMTLLKESNGGTLQMEIEKSTDNGVNWSTILSSPVELTGLAIGSLSGSVNFINTAAQSFNQNDLLRITFPGLQTDQGEFHVSIYGEVS